MGLKYRLIALPRGRKKVSLYILLSATIHHGGAMNARDASTIRYGASTVQAGSKLSAGILDF